MKKKILIALPILLILIQFVKIDKTPLDIAADLHLEKIETVPNNIVQILKISCYDCHSARADYPWYSNYAPVSFFLQNHVKGGRKKLNFAEWGTYDRNKRIHIVEEIKEVLEENRMPIKSYLWMHKEAAISDNDKGILIDFFEGINT